MSTYKIIKRLNTESGDMENFIATGMWGDGKLAYSLVEPTGEIKEENNGVFYQLRHNGQLVMVHI